MALKLPTKTFDRVLLGLKVAGVLAVAILLAVVVYRVFYAPRAARTQAATAIAQEEMAQGEAKAAQAGMNIVIKTQREIVQIDTTTRRNDNAIKSAGDAETRIPGVARELALALCLRAAYRDQPECAAVSGDRGGVGPAGRDAGSPAAVE